MMQSEISTENFTSEKTKQYYHNAHLKIEKINGNISYDEFFRKYLYLNVPCIIKNLSTHWAASRDWVKNNNPNYAYLSQKYGEFETTVSDCNKRHFNAQKTSPMTFKEYLNYFERYVSENECDNTMPLFYMKDFHLKKLSNDNFYTVPIYFSSDWLNEYFSEKTDDDYQFVYIGPKGTWTPFHVDVFTSFSWSTNVCGRKKWIFFPSGEEDHLRDCLGNLPYDVTKIQHDCKCSVVMQETGDTIFVPSGWHHQVYNEENTISINHNWVNGCNIKGMWRSLADSLDKVKIEIEDCKDMDGWLNHCQLMLKTYHGIDFELFYKFLYHIARKRIKLLKENIEIKQFDTWTLGRQHAVFDLMKIEETLVLFLKHEDVHSLELCRNGTDDPEILWNEIKCCLTQKC